MNSFIASTQADAAGPRSFAGATNDVRRRSLLALAPLLVAIGILGAIEMWNRPDPGFAPREFTVGVVDPGGVADRAGLRAGDVLVQMNGQPVHSPAAYWAYLHPLQPGDTLELSVLRSGVAGTLSLVLPERTLNLRLRGLLMAAVGTTFLFLGFVTYLRRGDVLGRYFYLTCLLLSYSFLPLPTFPWVPFMQILESVRSVLQLLLPAVLLRFFLIFPEGRGDEKARRRHRWLLVPPLVLAPFHVAFNFATRVDIRFLNVLQILSALLLVTYLVAALVVFFRKARHKDRWNLWSRLRLAGMSLAAGLVPFFLATLARQIWPSHGFPDQAVLLLLPLAPAGFSLALLRTGAIDLAYLVRRALVGVGLALPILVVALLLSRGLGPGDQGRELRYLLLVSGTFVAALLAVPMRRRVGSLVDRIFYPEQDRIRSEAARLAHELAQQRKPVDVAQILCDGCRDLFGARNAVLYRVGKDDHQRLAFTTQGTDPPERFSTRARLARLSLESKEMRLIQPLLTGRQAIRLDPGSRRLVETTDAALICPLVAGGKTVALLCLGVADSGRDYGALELYHVELLARQAAASLDNAILHEADLQRERVRTELDLAREIQSKLIPDAPLILPGIEIHGQMESSREIGGDLFDYFPIGDGRIAMTVADAAGKGVPASLLMSGVRSVLREVVQPNTSCSEALGRLNEDVVTMTGDRHFVALFLGILDPRTHVLEYGVAGIEPPLWVRGRVGRAERLTRGGPVLGVSPKATYRAGLIRLAPGDSVLAFSDGMIDEEDAREEPFSYSRLMSSSLDASRLPGETILRRLMDEVRAFGEGTSTDDRTLLVLRIADAIPQGTKDAAAMG